MSITDKGKRVISVEVISVEKMLLTEKHLSIPKYQRPYKWEEHHVTQLFDDILHHQETRKSKYRLGTVVIHKENEDKNIVDGQQRLTTLSLLAKCLELTDKVTLLNTEVSSAISIRHIKQNYAHLKNRCNQLNGSKETFKDYLLNNCELVYIELDNLGEAFQFFDSQNSRGKELASYDLLKAYHLREMSNDSEEERKACVESWEKSVSPSQEEDHPSLEVNIDLLYRIRQWTKGNNAGNRFERHDLALFKGINLKDCNYRYALHMKLINDSVNSYNEISKLWGITHNYPFSIDQTIINGKLFFQYIQYYSTVYHDLFLKDHSKIQNYLKIIKSYGDRGRVGDRRVRNLFYATILYYFDRFGDVELDKAARICFLWCYRIRLESSRIPTQTIDNKAKAKDGLVYIIKHAVHPSEILRLNFTKYKNKDGDGCNVKNINTLLDKYNEEFKND